MIWWWSGKEHFVKQQCIADKDQSNQILVPNIRVGMNRPGDGSITSLIKSLHSGHSHSALNNPNYLASLSNS